MTDAKWAINVSAALPDLLLRCTAAIAFLASWRDVLTLATKPILEYTAQREIEGVEPGGSWRAVGLFVI